MPERVPLPASVTPFGNVPLFKPKAVVPLPPLCVNVWLKDAPTEPVVMPGLVTVMVGQLTAKLLLVHVCPFPSFTLIVLFTPDWVTVTLSARIPPLNPPEINGLIDPAVVLKLTVPVK